MGSEAWFLMIKTKLVNFSPPLSAFFPRWWNAGGVSVQWGCILEEQPSGVQQELLLLPGAVFGQALPHMSFLALHCPNVLKPAASRAG